MAAVRCVRCATSNVCERNRTTLFTNLIIFNALLFGVMSESTQAELIFEAAFQGECRSNGPCQHLCFDLHDGTFECACRQGYTLSDNGYACIENHLLEEHTNESRIENDGKQRNSIEMIKDESSSGTDVNKEYINSQNYKYYTCTGIECEAGGVCIRDQTHGDSRVRCRCPIGRGGFFCEKPVDVRFPRFRGRSYLALPTLRRAHKSMKITIEFKPEYYDGILLYSGEKLNLEGDFIAVVLTHGFVEFRFDCGKGEGVIRSDRPVVLKSWNTLTIHRHGWSASIKLNSQRKISGQSRGLFSQITFKLELFLGGSPNVTLIAPRTNSYTGFEGCVRSLKINGHSYDFRSDHRGDAIDGVDIEECNSDVCSRTQCLNGGRCVAKSLDKSICLCPLGFSGTQCEFENNILEDRVIESRTENHLKERNSIEMMKDESSRSTETNEDYINYQTPVYYSCTGIECGIGGVCVRDHTYGDSRVRCRCPVGRVGFFCEKPMEVRFPRFRGTSFLELPKLRRARKSLKITIEFKPEYYDGILLYSGEKVNLDGDFIAVTLTQGFVEFRFDCGTGEGVIRSDRKVVLNSWNTLTIHRDGSTASIQLNSQRKISGQSQGLVSRITFKLNLFLGGSPNLTLIAPRINSHYGFEGCVRKLKINGHSYDFRSNQRGDSIDGVDIDECKVGVPSEEEDSSVKNVVFLVTKRRRPPSSYLTLRDRSYNPRILSGPKLRKL